MKVIRVGLDVPLVQLFDYRADDACSDDIGRRVVVPFGARKAVGIVVEIAESSSVAPHQLKSNTAGRHLPGTG